VDNRNEFLDKRFKANGTYTRGTYCHKGYVYRNYIIKPVLVKSDAPLNNMAPIGTAREVLCYIRVDGATELFIEEEKNK
jgi:hypothetical protein